MQYALNALLIFLKNFFANLFYMPVEGNYTVSIGGVLVSIIIFKYLFSFISVSRSSGSLKKDESDE